MQRLSNARVRLHGTDASPRTRLQQYSPRVASFADQVSLSARTQALWRTRRTSHGPSRAREYSRHRKVCIALRTQARSRQSIRGRLRPRFPPQTALRKYYRSDGPAQIGRASCRERGWGSGGTVEGNKKEVAADGRVG